MAENTGEDEVKTTSAEDDDPQKGEEEEDEKPEDEVPVRQSSKYFAQQRIIGKQAKQIEKLSKKEEGEPDEDDELTPKARSLIQKELSPYMDVLRTQADELELRDYLAEHPEHKKYEKVARKRINAWGNVPIEDIFKSLAYGQSEAKEKATEKVRRNSLGGSTSRPQEQGLPQSKEDMEKLYARVKRGETIKLG